MRLRAFLFAVALAAASTVQGQSPNTNVISKVEVQDSSGSLVISVQGTKPPNFTTFSMMDPPRFVIDFSESRFKDVPEELPVGGGIVKVIKNLAYGSGASAIARVMISFEQEVEPPEVHASGGTLMIKVMKPAGAAVASAAPASDRKDNGGGAAPAATTAAPPTGAKSGADQDDADRVVPTKAKVQQAKAEAEAKAKAEEEAKAEAAAKAKAAEEAKAEAAARAKAEEEAKMDAAAKVKAEEEAKADAAAKAKAQEQAKAEAEAKARVDAAAKAEQEAKAEVGKPETTAMVAPVPAGTRTERAEPVQRDSSAPSHVREVGFKLMNDFSRVFVRTDGRPEFTVQEAGENLVRLELVNTRVTRRNDTRFLDTSFFPSAVSMVTPKRQGSSYVLEIRLKQRVAFQQKLEGDMLAIDFERPASMRSAPGVESTSPPEAPAGAMLPTNGAEGPSEEAAPAGAAGN